jgi:hypothetical protein
MGKSTISMAIFNSFLYVYLRLNFNQLLTLLPGPCASAVRTGLWTLDSFQSPSAAANVPWPTKVSRRMWNFVFCTRDIDRYCAIDFMFLSLLRFLARFLCLYLFGYFVVCSNTCDLMFLILSVWHLFICFVDRKFQAQRHNNTTKTYCGW